MQYGEVRETHCQTGLCAQIFVHEMCLSESETRWEEIWYSSGKCQSQANDNNWL